MEHLSRVLCTYCGGVYESLVQHYEDTSRCRDAYNHFKKDPQYANNEFRQHDEVDPIGLSPKSIGAKLDGGKPMTGLLLDFCSALTEVAKVGTYGVKKYTRGSWLHVEDGINRYTDAMLRHLLKESMEIMDQDSHIMHEAHVAWNALARLELLLREITHGVKQNKSPVFGPSGIKDD